MSSFLTLKKVLKKLFSLFVLKLRKHRDMKRSSKSSLFPTLFLFLFYQTVCCLIETIQFLVLTTKRSTNQTRTLLTTCQYLILSGFPTYSKPAADHFDNILEKTQKISRNECIITWKHCGIRRNCSFSKVVCCRCDEMHFHMGKG